MTDLTETDLLLLRALQRVCTEGRRQRSVVTLRYALLWTRIWNDAIEDALCNGGDEEPLVDEYYKSLCKLVRDTPYAEGAGDFWQPAGPRYTACWITPAGSELLEQLAQREAE